MPTYVYECAKCGDELEVWQSFSEDSLKKHSGCGGKLTKVLQPVGIVFKGSGFHKTDSRSGSKRSGSNGASETSKPDSTKSESGDSKSDTKSDSKADAKSAKSDSGGAKKSEGAKTASTSSST